jgi:hypothetical protein
LKAERPDDVTVDRLFMESFGYPDDLPDLSSARPRGGNRFEDNKHSSYHARRARGELDAVY